MKSGTRKLAWVVLPFQAILYQPSSAYAVNEAKEGFCMARDIPSFSGGSRGSFWKVVAAFLGGGALPFARVLSAERIEQVFAKHGGLFGGYGIYSAAMMVWSFLGQVLRDGKEASCQAAVARVVSYREHEQIAPPTADTGDDCRARAKLSEAALQELSCEVAAETEAAAETDWLWKGKHAKLIDGFTFTMPDTAKHQAEYPQQKSQKPGVGLPIARVVTILSLATACAMDVALGPYAGKQTGEPALLRKLFGRLGADDIAVADRYYCALMMIALLLAQGTHVCAESTSGVTATSAAAGGWASTTTSLSGLVPPSRNGWTKPPIKRFPKRWNCARFVSA